MSGKITLFSGRPVDIYQAAFSRKRTKILGGRGYFDRRGENPFANKNDALANLHPIDFWAFEELRGALIRPKSSTRITTLSTPTNFKQKFNQIVDGILTRINRQVRQELIEPNLSIVVDDALFSEIVELDIKDDPFGFLKGHAGFFLNRTVIEQSIHDNERELYEKIFSILDKKLMFRTNRIALIPRVTLLCSPWTVVHEVIHDVIDMSARRYPEAFARLIDRIHNMIEHKEDFATSPYGRDNGPISFSHLFFVVTNISYWTIEENDREGKSKAVKEFAAKFFSGQLIDQSTEYDDSCMYRFAYYYIQTKMPQDVRDMFYELGLRWPPAIKMPTDRR